MFRSTLRVLRPASCLSPRVPLLPLLYRCSHTTSPLAGKTYFQKDKTEAELMQGLHEKGRVSFINEDMGFETTSVSEGVVTAKMEITQHHMASNGFIHAASIITLADTACGFGCYVHLPPDSSGFTTIELKSNFIGSATVGKTLSCTATLIHSGKSTQVWDAVVSEGGKEIAFFRCTEIILYKK